ncbi:MAG: glycosyltransferase [Brevibacterium aurantiacum]|uniref:glycosyltransferase n=1 Tax=Brevibacterium aurantiacum TaxID=273384 RepID=UPI003F8E1A1F
MSRTARKLLSRIARRGGNADSSRESQLPNSWPTDPETGFPDASYFATFGELGDSYGGTANAVIHRSKAIVESTGFPLDILTFGHLNDYAALNRRFLDDGRFVSGLQFRNMWSELSSLPSGEREASDDRLLGFEPLGDSQTDEVLTGEGVPLRRFRKDSNGRNLQIDMCRSDGTVILSDRRDVFAGDLSGAAKSQRALILCDSGGAPIRFFRSMFDLRTYWLDRVVGDSPAVMFSDTFGVSGFTHTYKRSNVLVVQTFHNRHLDPSEVGPLGMSEARYLPFLNNVDDFDATVFQTTRQKDDVDRLMGYSPQRHVIPNSRSLPDETDFGLRRENRAISVGRLVHGKQLDHAVRAIGAAGALLEHPLEFHIYGDGSALPAVESQIVRSGVTNTVLHGHDPHAQQRFAQASFSLLTSRSESMSLVLVEAMARGCVPIAYDVQYGPREIITHAEDGFLVEANNEEALAATIVEFQQMDPARREKMRAAAVVRARDFSDAAILRKWARLLQKLAREKRDPAAISLDVSALTSHRSEAGFVIGATATADRELERPRFHLTIKGRREPALTRVDCTTTPKRGRKWIVEAVISPERIEWIKDDIIDLQLEVHDCRGRGVRRLPFGVEPKGQKSRSQNGLAAMPFEPYSTVHGNFSLRRL